MPQSIVDRYGRKSNVTTKSSTRVLPDRYNMSMAHTNTVFLIWSNIDDLTLVLKQDYCVNTTESEQLDCPIRIVVEFVDQWISKNTPRACLVKIVEMPK